MRELRDNEPRMRESTASLIVICGFFLGVFIGARAGLARVDITRDPPNLCPKGAVMVVVAGADVPGGYGVLVRGDGGWVPSGKGVE